MQQARGGVTPGRLVALDGLRGLVALSVIVFHFFLETLGPTFSLYASPLVAGLTSSNVGIFLMLSGFVLSDGNWRLEQKPRVQRHLVKRYFRLTIPMLSSVLVVLAILRADLSFHVEASRLLQIEHWLGGTLAMQPSLGGAIYDATLGTYLPHPTALSYNPFLWTMQCELWGSLALFAILLLDRRVPPYSMLIAGIILFYLIQPVSCALLVGGLLALLKHDGYLDHVLAALRRHAWLAPVCLAVAFSIGAVALPSGNQGAAAPFAAMCVLLPVLACPALQRPLSVPAMQFLGRLSLPLLLVQFPVLISFTCWGLLQLAANESFNMATATLLTLASLGLCLVGATAFLPIERLTIRFCSRLSTAVLGSPPRALPAPMPS